MSVSRPRSPEPDAPPADRLGRLLVLAFVVVAGIAALGIGARAEHDARTTADEPQYLLSAISLAEDFDLNIRDELAQHRERAFHESVLPQQTAPLDGGRTRLSPHDPLLPVLLAGPVRLGLWAGGDTGAWIAAKAFLALCAGALAVGTIWVAVRRFGVRPATAVLVVGACSVIPPLVVYGTQVYPELLAALAVVAVVGALTGGRPGRLGPMLVLVAGLVALPWLSVKYLPVVAALGLVALGRLWRTGARWQAGALLVTGVLGAASYGLVHQGIYGGWTPYAAGDHFVGGELTVVGSTPDYLGRSVRVVGLLVDRDFGLAAWAPVLLLAVPALGAMLRRRPPGWMVLVAPLVAGWLTATFVALTMHGWWWPGRQVVVILPSIVVTLAWGLDTLRVESPVWWPRARAVVVGLSAYALVVWGWLLVEVLRRERELIIDFAATSAPLSSAWRSLLPDGQAASPSTAPVVVWTVALALSAVAGWRAAGRCPPAVPLPADLILVARP